MISFASPVSAQEDLKIPTWVEQFFNSMKQKSENVQESIEKKQEELLDKAIDKGKEESKEMVENWIQRKITWIEELFNPLKIKIQQGSDIIREWIENIKKYFK